MERGRGPHHAPFGTAGRARTPGFSFPVDIARGNRQRAFSGGSLPDALREPAIMFVNNPQFPTVWRNKNEGSAAEPTNEGREK